MNLREVLKELGTFDIDAILKRITENNETIDRAALHSVLTNMAMSLQEQGFLDENFNIKGDWLDDEDFSVLVDVEITEVKPEEIPLAGAVIPEQGVVIDAIDNEHYFYTNQNKHMVVDLEFEEEKGKRGRVISVHPFIYDEDGNKIYIKGVTAELNGLPKSVLIQKLQNVKRVDTVELYNQTFNFIKKFVDSKEEYKHLATLFVFQSWVFDVLNSVFYLAVRAPFGGGKTTYGSVIVELCKNGLLASDLSTAGLARKIHYLSPAVFVDEIDQTADDVKSEFLRILRMGQRRDGAWYIRADNNSSRTNAYFVFGPKVFSVHSELEEALAQRCFTVMLYPTKKIEYTLKNLTRKPLVPSLYTKFLLWRHTTGQEVMLRLKFARVASKGNKFHYNMPFVKEALAFVIDAFKNIGLSGRNVELLFNISILASALGILDNIRDQLRVIIEQKKKEDEIMAEKEYKAIFKEVLTRLYNTFVSFVKVGESKYIDADISPEDLISTEGELQLPRTLIYTEYRRKLKREGLYVIGDRKISGILTDLMIRDAFTLQRRMIGIEWDKEKVAFVKSSRKSPRFVVLFTKDVCEKLGLGYYHVGGDLNSFEEVEENEQ